MLLLKIEIPLRLYSYWLVSICLCFCPLQFILFKIKSSYLNSYDVCILERNTHFGVYNVIFRTLY